jgi:HPt (histidine-containing phosphotransfer) domain-containing protein
MMPGNLTSSAHGMAGSPAIDRGVLSEWLDGDDGAINALLGLFYESICDEAERMRDLLAQENFEQFAGAAHRLRGAALSMGARALAASAGLLFTAALAKDRSACFDGVPVLATHMQRVKAEIPASGPSA